MYLFAKLLAGGFIANKVLLIKQRPVAVKECNGCIDLNHTAQQMHGLSSVSSIHTRQALQGNETSLHNWSDILTLS